MTSMILLTEYKSVEYDADYMQASKSAKYQLIGEFLIEKHQFKHL